MRAVPGANRSGSWAAAVGSLAVGASFLALWFWLLPAWLGFHVDLGHLAWWRWIAVGAAALGFAVAVRCVWDFGWTGHGTPSPVAPPRRLVVVGFYRYVRNPMYLGFLTNWAGLWVAFGRASAEAIIVTVIAGVVIDLFVRFYEEPHLRSVFGAEYVEYCRNVRRWLPRLHPWSR